MGCPNRTPFSRLDDAFEYEETIRSSGKPLFIDFRKRNREVLRAWTHDQTMTFTWTPAGVFVNGPAGTEVIVVFKIL